MTNQHRRSVEWGGGRRRIVAIAAVLSLAGVTMGAVAADRNISWSKPKGGEKTSVSAPTDDRNISWSKPVDDRNISWSKPKK